MSLNLHLNWKFLKYFLKKMIHIGEPIPSRSYSQVNFLGTRLKSLLVSYPAQYIDFRAAIGDKAAARLVVWLPCLPKIYRGGPGF